MLLAEPGKRLGVDLLRVERVGVLAEAVLLEPFANVEAHGAGRYHDAAVKYDVRAASRSDAQGGTMQLQAAKPPVGPAADPARMPLPCAKFDRLQMKTAAGLGSMLNWLLDYPRHAWLFWFLRWAAPVFRVPLTKVFIVTRYDDVREVLGRDAAFPVPWDEKMEGLTDNQNFVLGMARDNPARKEHYERSYEQLASVFKREDIDAFFNVRAAEVSAQKLAGRKSMDIIQDLMWAVPTQLTEDYYGIPIPDKSQFAYCTVAVSGYLFGPPNSPSDDTQLARAAAGCVRGAIADGISLARAAVARNTHRKDQVLPRLIQQGASDEVITAQLFGMILGFIPTNLIASGNIIDTLFRQPQFMAAALAAVRDNDDQRLWHCLQEALRFRFINPGAWRRCAPGGATIAAGTPRETRIPEGATLLVSLQSAMFDERRVKLPREFNILRPPEDYLVFGYGQHWCIGAYMAMAQITQTFKALLSRKALRRAAGPSGELRRITIYPASMTVELDA